MIMRCWKYSYGNRFIATIYAEVSYSAVLQQLSRHRSFSLSVGSSRAMELSRPFVPDWRGDRGSMFRQGELPGWKKALANIVWVGADYGSRLAYRMLRTLRVHLQHAQLVRKPFVMVPVYITGADYAWQHFLQLRLASDAQSDIRNFANDIRYILETTKSVEVDEKLLVGPYLEEPVPIGIALQLPHAPTPVSLSANDPSPVDPGLKRLCMAIAKVGRITTGKHGAEMDEYSAISWARRAYNMRHASVFEHHYAIDTSRSQCNPLRIGFSVRDLILPGYGIA